MQITVDVSKISKLSNVTLSLFEMFFQNLALILPSFQ